MSEAAEIVQELLSKRGITEAERSAFLEPVFERDIYSPASLPDIQLAVERIATAIANQEQITVFGDYDADGVPATALLLRTLRRVGALVKGIIPLRSEGYGLTEAAVNRIIDCGTQLLITVDNGTVARAEVAALRQHGIQTIICDHHEVQAGQMAEALAVINPKRADSLYPCRELCACALAWKLSWALYEYLGVETAVLKWELDLVAVSTVGDMVSLRGENRSLVQFGLKTLRRSRNVGLRELAEIAGCSLKQITASDIGFRLAPRLNATSRMHQELLSDKNASLELLVTEELHEAKLLAAHLHHCNLARQTLVQSHLKDAELQAAGLLDQLCLVLYEEQWSSGVIGLVAGRMLETYQRPVLALAMEQGQIKGSVRSVEGVSVLDLLESAHDVFERYGGHAKAGGLTMNSTDVASLQQRLHSWLCDNGASLAGFAKSAERVADVILPLALVNLELADSIQSIAPFGTDFAEPIFASRVQIQASRMVGTDGKHFSCLLTDGSAHCKAIGFNMEDPKGISNTWYQAEYMLQAEEWQGKRTASCILKRLTLI